MISNIRPLNEKKYGISKHRFLEVFYFCLQYSEWKDELKYKTDAVGSIDYSADRIDTSSNGDSTSNIGMRRAELSKRCELIEETVREAGDEIYPYLLKAVTTEGMTYNYLKMIMDIPCGKKMYYERRRKFYYLISQKI